MSRRCSFLSGVVEGYYGQAWDHATRLQIVSMIGGLGLSAFLYGPKSDHYLRRSWQSDWPEREWRRLRELAAHASESGVLFGVGLSPYALYDNYGNREREALRNKVERLNALGAPLLALLFDDMPGEIEDLASRQSEIVADLLCWTESERVLVCPTYYSDDPVLEKHFGKRPSGYWEQLGAQLARDVDLFWTGPQVCSDTITARDLEPVVQQLQRPLVLWDNYPVNDGAVRSKHLYLNPLAGRDPDIREHLSGHLCNPMNQAWLSLPALCGLATLYGHKPKEDWLAQVLGEHTLALIRRDAHRFLERGLDGLDARDREQLVSEYTAAGTPAAAEVVGWLSGKYTFDPACLTD